MFATRDQENLVHARQTTAAGKPLNQGVRSLQPKTPGNTKTPFRAPKNDENQPFLTHGPKTLIKGGGGKFDPNAFVTPAATKSRAILGAKTTNARAQPLKTPGFGQTLRQDKPAKQLSSTRRSTRKITVASTEIVPPSAGEFDVDDEPDFGYAPPPIKELPDPPIEFNYDQNFPQFRPENMFKGYGEIYFGSPTDENGFSIRLKQQDEKDKLAIKEEQRRLLESIKKEESARLSPDDEVDAMIAAGPKIKESKINTIKAKSAAGALSASTAPPSHSKLNAAITYKKPPSLSSRPLPLSTKAPFSVSRNTIGFPKAKQAPSILPNAQRRQADRHNQQAKSKPPNQRDIHPTEFVRLYGEPPVESDMWFRLKQHELLQQESQTIFDVDDDDLSRELNDFDLFAPTMEDDVDVFQLPVPED